MRILPDLRLFQMPIRRLLADGQPEERRQARMRAGVSGRISLMRLDGDLYEQYRE